MPQAQSLLKKSPEVLVVGLACDGDRDAFAELVRRRQSWVRNLMRRCCGDPALADDLAQAVFLQAWRNIGQLRKPSGFGGWLKRLAVTVWLQHLRKHDALRNADEFDEAAAAFSSGPGSDPGIVMDLERALATLPAPVRLCVVLSYHEGMPHGEIAEFTGFPLGTVKSHIQRGSGHLQTVLSAYHEEKPSENAP